jgi:glutaredoxin 3
MTMGRAEVVIYTAPLCSFCTAAKVLLERKGVVWREIRVDQAPEERRAEMEALSGRRTVPQIFIDGRPVGGYQDLRALDLAGELDALLADQSASA